MDGNTFFTSFPGFESDPSAPASTEFFRLARHMGWESGTATYREIKARCFRSEFAAHFGRDASKLQHWQGLCLELGIEERIETISSCKKALAEVYVNIVDLVDCRRTGDTPHTFSSLEDLRRYTKSSRKIFPRDEAKEEGFLKALLRGLY
ncbi:hypothetical protein K469DRAFT_574704 [Zopfia rhizophila CBS 207.26]|uniref:Uncharacterized protein n=1 Tax=Zopfia rhizophila CBS 207.26 TaxID=1314779 RepID=A0A6A6E617_9PEZI|nr:hypothetical protein K469DRAFT_574704 [Zopfia rhizophila CBS 207.26]